MHVRIALRTDKEDTSLKEDELCERRERKRDVDEDTRRAERRGALRVLILGLRSLVDRRTEVVLHFEGEKYPRCDRPAK